MKIKALDYLEASRLLHISMIEPIRRNTCEILYANNDGVLIYEKNSGAYMLSTNSIDLANRIIDKLPKKELFVVHQKALLELVKNKFSYNNYFGCKQAAYLQNTPSKIIIDSRSNINIRLLDDRDKSIIAENYTVMNENGDYTSRLIDNRHMWGAFDKDVLMGFIGIHSEGSMGLLEVLPQYRNRGIAQKLQNYLMTYMLNKDWIPFAQIVIDNEKSINLQKKLGLTISEESVYWLY